MRQDVDFHLQANDYFGTLATVLDLIRQDLRRRRETRHCETLSGLCDELNRLQRTCRIESLARGRKELPRLRGSVRVGVRRPQKKSKTLLRTESNFCAECGVHLVSGLPGSIENRGNSRD